MAKLVRQYRLDLIGLEAVEQGIEEHDTFVAAETGEIGIAVRRTL